MHCVKQSIPLEENQGTKQDRQHQYTYSTHPLLGATPGRASLAWHSPLKNPHSPYMLLDLWTRGNPWHRGFALWIHGVAFGSSVSSCSPAVWSQPVAPGGGHYQHREMQHLSLAPWDMLQQGQKSTGNTTEACNTMNSHSLIHKMPEINSTQQNGQGATEKNVLLCTMSFFMVELSAWDSH